MQHPDGGARRPAPGDGVRAHGVAEQIRFKVKCVGSADASLNSIADDLQESSSVVPGPDLKKIVKKKRTLDLIK